MEVIIFNEWSNLKTKKLIKTSEKSEIFLLLLSFLLKTRALSNWPPHLLNLCSKVQTKINTRLICKVFQFSLGCHEASADD